MRITKSRYTRTRICLILFGCLIPVGVAEGQKAPADTEAVALVITSQAGFPKTTRDQLANMRDVAVTRAGIVYMLDVRREHVEAYSRTGELVHDIPVGTVGSTAGAALIGTLGATAVLVYDAESHRVGVFTVDDPSDGKTRSIPVMRETAKDMCTVGDSVYLLADHNDRLIHAYALRGRFQRSFGEAPGSNRAVRSAVVGAGAHIACSEALGIVVAGFTAAGQVIAFRSNGTRAWAYSVPDFQGIEIRTLPDSTAQLRWSGRARDGVVSVFTVGDGYVAVQVRRIRATRQWLDTIILRLRDGAAVGTQVDIPMMTRSAGAFLVGTEDAPPLHARVYTYRVEAHGR